MVNLLTTKHFMIPTLVLGSLFAGIPVVKHFYRPVKHTQNCTLVRRYGPCDWFTRPNGEFFEACWDNPPQILFPGIQLKDITYTDDNSDRRHFIKAQLEPR